MEYEPETMMLAIVKNERVIEVLETHDIAPFCKGYQWAGGDTDDLSFFSVSKLIPEE